MAEPPSHLADDPPVGPRLAGRGRKARWREMRRSELVTVPSFSPQAAAGSKTGRAVGVGGAHAVGDCHLRGTGRSRPRSASRTRSGFGRLTAGLVAMTHSALMRPLRHRVEQLDRLEPAPRRPCGRAPEARARFPPRRRRRRNRHAATSWLASPPTSRPPMALGWPVSENGPAARLADPPGEQGGRLMIALTLSVPELRLVDALRAEGDRARAAPTTSHEAARAWSGGRSQRPRRRRRRARCRGPAASAASRPRRVRGDEGLVAPAPRSGSSTRSQSNSTASVPGFSARCRSAPSRSPSAAGRS